MTLVPLKDLLSKYSISRATYHNLLNKGVLPHYSKRFGEAGRRGAQYLYDAEVFEEAWLKYAQKRKRGLGINVTAARKQDDRIARMSKSEKLDFVLENLSVLDGESLTEYEIRVAARRAELDAVAEEELLPMATALVEQGFTPRLWR